VDANELARTFVDLTDTLVEDFDVPDLLYTLATGCVKLLDDVAATGLVFADRDDSLQVAASSTGAAKFLELFQLEAHEGPCVECYRSGEQVVVEHLEGARVRWPRFVPAAMAQGYVSVSAVPMRLRGQIVGALNLFGNQQTSAVAQDLPIAQAMADVATIAILQHRLTSEQGLIADQLQQALQSRVVIEQAKGVLGARLRRSPDDVFELLRSRARTTRRRLAEVADEVVRGDWTGEPADEAGPPR
jgi:transcriptional regulator with GAF, ATPase, and Fis domain